VTTFRYRAKDKSGQTLDGTMVGDDRHSVAARLQEMGYFVLELAEVRESRTSLNPVASFLRWTVNPVFAGVSTHHLALFYRQLATMVKSGMTLTHAMSALRVQGTCRRLRKIAGEAVEYMQSGGTLSEAFARYPWVFPELHISLIRAAEMGGTLDSTLQRIADYLEREVRIRQKLRMSTLYPKIVLLAVILIPRFPILIFDGFDAYAHSTIHTVAPMLLWLLGLWIVFRLLSQISVFRQILDSVKLCVPKLGSMVKMLALSRYYRALAAMYSAGAPLSQSLIHAANASGNTFLAGRLRRAAPPVEKGTRLSDALAATRVLPRMALDMISTGEQTGNMDEMLDRVAEYTENEAEVAVFQSTLVLGVLLLLAVAAYVGTFVVQYYVGMYSNVMNH